MNDKDLLQYIEDQLVKVEVVKEADSLPADYLIGYSNALRDVRIWMNLPENLIKRAEEKKMDALTKFYMSKE